MNNDESLRRLRRQPPSKAAQPPDKKPPATIRARGPGAIPGGVPPMFDRSKGSLSFSNAPGGNR